MAIRKDAPDLIEFLNSLAKIDPKAMGALVATRVPCNEAMANHPTVQVAAAGEIGNSQTPTVGVLGILNGYAGAYDDGPRKGWGPITAVVEDDGSVSEFKTTLVC